ncbi:hypothetical protein HPB47_017449 [Ixodes persulcatus]|uniref:Uncharacterized protein n=1 Tax=Ixodes persulcatus TaxID=34615 RepID=A0AC60QNE5_IXOPE|nr:hypothetical protein HPB47_017449 [Ixodes persulcatus]
MAALPFLRLSETHRFFTGENAAFEKGERKYLEGYVLSFEVKDFTLVANVQASLKNCSYTVKMTLSDKGDILESHCECPRGAAKCSHMAAAALHAALNGLSKTDLPQQWLQEQHAAAGRSLSAIIWGQVHEADALKEYEGETGSTVTKSVLWLHQSGVLGGSPYGLLGTDGLVEAKCPWTWREHKIKEAFGTKVMKLQ